MELHHSTEKPPIPVLYVHYGDEWIRGSERCLLDLLNHLDQRRFTPILWCNSDTLASEVAKQGAVVIRSPFPLLLGWQSPRYDIRAFARLIRQGIQLVDRFGIRLIHANSGAPNQWLNLVARARHLPLLAHLHARYPRRDRLSLGLHQVSMVVGVSQPVVKQLLDDGVPTNACAVIPNGIDTQRQQQQPAVELRKQLALSPNDYLLVTTASLIHRKGLDLLIDAVSALRTQEIPVVLAIIGEGPERASLQQQIHCLGLQHHVSLLGERNDVAGLLRGGVDLFVSAAREEVFGLVLAEAGLAELPVVAPAVGGIPSVVVDGQTGTLVPANDSDALARAIKRLYNNPQQARKMGSSARLHVLKHFTIESNVNRFQQLYCQMIGDPSSHMCWHSHWRLLQPLFFNARSAARLAMETLGKRISL